MKYKVTKAVESKNWVVGDIVEVVGRLEDGDGVLEPYLGDEPNKHVLVMVEPVKLSGKVNETN